MSESQVEKQPPAPPDWQNEDEELGLVLISREHDEITALLPQLGALHKSLREAAMPEHLGAIEDTIGYLSVRLQDMWSEYFIQTGIGRTALSLADQPPTATENP